MDERSLRAAAAAIFAVTGHAAPLPDFAKEARRHPKAIARLLEAKRESDRRNYPAKHAILRDLIRAHPGHFRIDSEAGSVVGLTHQSGFRIHMPRRALPDVLRRAGGTAAGGAHGP